MKKTTLSQKKIFGISINGPGCWIDFAVAFLFSVAAMYGAGYGAIVASNKNPGTENGAMMILAFFCFPIVFGPGLLLGMFLKQLTSKLVKSLKLQHLLLVVVNAVLFCLMLFLGFLLGLLPWIAVLTDQLI